MNIAKVLSDRIDGIINLIPEDYIQKQLVVALLRDRQGSIAYTAPEVIGVRFKEVGVILTDHLPEPESSEWTKQITALFAAEVT